jgi:hypothetical protein
MADLKISQLTAITAMNLAGTDVLAIVDTSATTTKKVALNDVAEFVAASDAISGVIATEAPEPDYTSDQAVLAAAIF